MIVLIRVHKQQCAYALSRKEISFYFFNVNFLKIKTVEVLKKILYLIKNIFYNQFSDILAHHSENSGIRKLALEPKN